MSEKFGERIRQAFIAPPGYVWFGADYSQIEIRTFALVSGSQRLIDLFQDPDADVHSWVVAEGQRLTGVLVPRRTAKVLTFGGFFDQQEASAYLTVYQDAVESGQPPPTRAEFHVFYQVHRRAFPELPGYHAKIRHQIETRGYVETWFGRRYDVSSPYGHEARSAISMPIQGTAADIVKLAIPPVLAVVRRYGGKLIGQVHDELPSYIPEDRVEEAAKAVKETMEQCVKLPIPLKVDVKWGHSWFEAH